MADTPTSGNGAVFQEIIEVRADPKAFVESLNALTSAFNEWLQKLGASAEQVVGVGMFAQVQGALASLSAEINTLNLNMVNTLEGLSEAWNKLSDKIGVSTKKQSSSTAKSVEEQIAALDKLNAKIVDTAEKKLEANKLFQEGKVPKGLPYVDDIAIEREGLLNKQAAEANAQMVKEFKKTLEEIQTFEEKTASAVKKRFEDDLKHYEQLATAEQRELERKAKLGQIEENLAAKARQRLQEDIALQRSAAVAEEQARKAREAAGKAADDLARAAQGRLNEELKQADAAAKAEERYAAAVAKSVDLMKQLQAARFSVEGMTVDPSQSVELQRLLTLVQEIKALRAAGVGQPISGIVSDADLERVEKLNKLQAEAVELTKKLEKQTLEQIQAEKQMTTEIERRSRQAEAAARREEAATRRLEEAKRRAALEAEGLFAKWIRGLQQTFMHLTRYYFAFTVLTTASRVFADTIGLPFILIRDGVKYIRDNEDAAADLVGVMMQNVAYADNYVDRLAAARKVADELVLLLQDRAAVLGLPEETLRGTVKALLDAGAARGVKNMSEMVRLAELFQLTLRAAGVGALAAQGSVSEISKLMRGNVDASNKFLQGLQLTRAEWEKIRDEGMKHGDLLERLTERAKPFLDQTQLMELTASALVTQFDLLRKRVAQQGSAALFTWLRDGLKSLNQWIKDNHDSLILWIKDFGDTLLAAGQAVYNFFTADVVKFAIGTIVMLIKAAVDEIIILVDGIGTGLKQVWTLAKGVKGGFSGIKQAWEEMNKEGYAWWQRTEQRFANFNKLLGSLTNPPEQQKKGLETWVDTFFKAIGNENKIASAGQVLKEEWDAIKQQFQHQVDEIQNTFEELGQFLDEQVAEEKLSQRQRAENLAQFAEVEKTILQRVLSNYQQEAAKKRKELLDDAWMTLTADQARALERSLDNELEQVNRSIVEAIHRINKRVAAARKQGAAEDQQIIRQNFKNSLETLKREYDQEAEKIEDLAQFGYYDPLVKLNKEIEVAEKRHAAVMAELLAEEERLRQEGAEKYTAAVNRRLAEEQRWAGQVERFSRLRAQLEEEEFNRTQEFSLRMTKAHEDALAASAEMQDLLSGREGYTEALMELNEAKLRGINLSEQEVARQLTLAAVQGKGIETIRQLASQYKDLRNERLQLLAAELAQIRQTPDALYREIRTEDWLRRRQPELEKEPKIRENLRRDSSGRARAQAAVEQLLGIGFFGAINAASSGLSRFAVGMQGAVNAVHQFSGIIDAWREGYAKGGLLGGMGSMMGLFADALVKLPVIGKFIPIVSGVFSFIGGLFTKAARNIAEEVQRDFESTLNAYRDGDISLVVAISDLERQRREAIVRLSGKKGGKEELDKLLPEFDRELKQLRQAQEKFITDFEQSLWALQQHSETLVEVNEKWQQINQQVREYIGAGGDAVKAAEFLSLSLARLRSDALQELSRAEQDAIKDAIALNDLLKQRNQLVDEFKQREFDLINQTALERRQAGSVQRGRELQKLREEHEMALKEIDAEITRTQIKVEKQQQIFDLNLEIEALHRRDEQLALEALDLQIKKLMDLKRIADGIQLGPGGWTAAPGFFTAPGNLEINVTVPPPAPNEDPRSYGEQIADGILGEIRRTYRMQPAY